MDTIIDIPADILNKPGVGTFSVGMSVYTAGALLKALQSVDLSQFSEMDRLTVEVFTTFVATHVKENAIEKLAALGVQDIDTFLEDK